VKLVLPAHRIEAVLKRMQVEYGLLPLLTVVERDQVTDVYAD
jgi:hypothetical protein